MGRRHLHPLSNVLYLGGSGDAEHHGDGVEVPALPAHSLPFTLQLCVEFIKDTLSVEQVCEALQVSGTWL